LFFLGRLPLGALGRLDDKILGLAFKHLELPYILVKLASIVSNEVIAFPFLLLVSKSLRNIAHLWHRSHLFFRARFPDQRLDHIHDLLPVLGRAIR